MNQGQENYQQKYFPNTSGDNYDEYYEDDYIEYQDDCGDVAELQAPNVQLYPEGAPDLVDVYTHTSPIFESAPHIDVPYRRPTTSRQTGRSYSNNQYNQAYNQLPPINQVYVPQTDAQYLWQQSHPYQYSYADDYYDATLDNQYDAGNANLKKSYDDYYHIKQYRQARPKTAEPYRQTRPKTADRYATCADCSNEHPLKHSMKTAEMYVNYEESKVHGYVNRAPKSALVKKYPITIKTPKYINKNFLSSAIGKKPSTLCVPVVTQPDPGLSKRRSKTNQKIKKGVAQSELLPPDNFEQPHTYSAHEMHSEGDVKSRLPPKGIDTFFDKIDNSAFFKELGFEDAEKHNIHQIQEIAKFLQPRVPTSVKLKQEQCEKMKATKSLQPKMKLSLDKLLDRLQKCENSGRENKSDIPVENKEGKSDESKKIGENQEISFNYESLNRKCTAASAQENQNEAKESNPKSRPRSPVSSTKKTPKKKRSIVSIRPMDDHCALDLHRSKSYIVDLIDRALSKELGTVPRKSSELHNFTPKKAIATISRHRSPKHHPELCYEVTAALTDSFISNATAPNPQVDQMIEQSNSDGQIEKRGDDSYIKQLKQLRWGHIRHIQHEARKLADLEEFLEKCGEIDF